MFDEFLNKEINAIVNKQSEPLVFTEMADAYAEPKKEEKTFGDDEEGLRKAARETDQRRQEKEPEPIERKYIDVETGKDMPLNQTVSLERAATDLERQRGFEAAEANQVVNLAGLLCFNTERAAGIWEISRPWNSGKCQSQRRRRPSQLGQSLGCIALSLSRPVAAPLECAGYPRSMPCFKRGERSSSCASSASAGSICGASEVVGWGCRASGVCCCC